ncbi:MAG: PEP-CTERM sorting domain-containing protein [Opitutales bacterium]|nr:PEP-CTERM sorting domain-containing protein [Opitutales bacterium]
MIKLLFATGALLSGGVLFTNAQEVDTTSASQKSSEVTSAVLDILQTNDYGYHDSLTDSRLSTDAFGFIWGRTSVFNAPWIFDSIRFEVKFRLDSIVPPPEESYGIRYLGGDGNEVKGEVEFLENYNIDLTGQNPTVISYKFDTPQVWAVGESKILMTIIDPRAGAFADVRASLYYGDEVASLVVPEPSAFGMLAGLGALALVAARRRRK